MSGDEREAKKAKVEPWTGSYKMNLSECLVKDAEGLSLHDIVDGPISNLQGVSERADAMMEILGVSTVREFASWKFGKWSTAMVTLAELERDGKRPDGSLMNIDLALDKEHEAKSLSEVVDLPVSALQGLTPKADELLKTHHVDTIAKLGKWKYIIWARALVDLVDAEETMSPEERKQARMLKKLE